MRRQSSYAPKFKRIERSIRVILLEYSTLLDELDSALCGKRTKIEIAKLNALKSESKELHIKTTNLLKYLFD